MKSLIKKNECFYLVFSVVLALTIIRALFFIYNYTYHDLTICKSSTCLYYLLHNSLTSTILTAVFVWQFRFTSRYANVLLAFVVMSVSVATLEVVESGDVSRIIFFIILNNMAFFPFVFGLPIAPSKTPAYLSDIESKKQNKRYILIFLVLSIFGGALVGLLLIMILPIVGALLGAIPAISLAWIVTVFRLQRNANGVMVAVLSGVALGTLHGALTIYAMEWRGENLLLFTCGGFGLSLLVACFLPKPTTKQATSGISSFAVRKRLGITFFGGTAVCVLIFTILVVIFDSENVYRSVNASLPVAWKVLSFSVVAMTFVMMIFGFFPNLVKKLKEIKGIKSIKRKH